MVGEYGAIVSHGLKELVMAVKESYPWQDKICNYSQVGGIETSVLDDGPGRHNRIAWVNTGTGLRYKVVIDRCLDIADTFFNQHSLAWISQPGVTAPMPDANRGLAWLYSFGGGLLATCGLTHVGGPESDDSGERGLHGRIGNIPASIESIIQPDPANGKGDMSITAVVRQSCLFLSDLELRRTISSRIGEPTIRIKDVVTNRACTPTPHMLIYHCNFVCPLVDEGTDIVYKGKCKSLGRDMDNAIFNSKHNYRKCCKPLDSHRGGEACGIIDVKPDNKGFCTVGLYNRKLKLAVALKYKKKQLPWLTNWQHWGFGDYVTGIEPGTNPPTGQIKAREQKQLITLKPGQKRTYELEISVLTGREQISKFTKTAGR